MKATGTSGATVMHGPDDFRCPGCELNTMDGRLCERCRREWESLYGDEGGEA